MASAAILSGGQAKRFGGRDKGALVVNGRRIIDRLIDEVSHLTDDILLVGGSPHAADSPSGIRLVPDRVPDSGPLGGLDAALAAARDPVVLLIACDMPFVTAALLERLLEFAGSADAVVPRTERGYHPLCAVYSHGCREAVQRRLAARKLAMLGLLEEVRVRVVDTNELRAFGPPDRLLANINTPADFDALGKLERHKV